MKITLYDHSDEFLKDNKKFIYDNSLEADLVYGNAHCSLSKDEGFYGASVKNGDDILLAVQVGAYPRVHYSICKNAKEMTDVLVESYVNNHQIPKIINGDTKTVHAMIESFKTHSVEYTLHMDMLKKKCVKLVDVPVLPLKIVKAKTLDFDFTDFYIKFATECNVPFDQNTAKEKTDAMVSNGTLYALVDNGKLVAIAASARKTEKGKAINLVYTPPEFRGKGYSTCCVKQLTKIILNENDYAYLYTDRSNPISNHVYEKLGFKVFGEFCQYNRKSI